MMDDAEHQLSHKTEDDLWVWDEKAMTFKMKETQK